MNPSQLTATQDVTEVEYAARVLLVDDQMIVGEAVRRALASTPSVSFHFCSKAEEALQTAERVKPTVILQDLVMPGVCGLALVREYRSCAVTRDIPVIVLSTTDEATLKVEAFNAGANDYLVKLPDAIELLARIRYHSKAYLAQVQRDDAHRALHETQRQLLEMNVELQRLSTLDGLTGLSNRRYFNEYFATEWQRGLREHTTLCSLMVDVDDFKRYNDTYGHLAGDEVLKRLAQRIEQSATRPADLAARFGGEEFVVVLPNTTLEGAVVVAQNLCSAIAALEIPHKAARAASHVSVSVGVAAAVPSREGSALALLDASDVALYQAKKTGRNRAVAYCDADLPHAATPQGRATG